MDFFSFVIRCKSYLNEPDGQSESQETSIYHILDSVISLANRLIISTQERNAGTFIRDKEACMINQTAKLVIPRLMSSPSQLSPLRGDGRSKSFLACSVFPCSLNFIDRSRVCSRSTSSLSLLGSSVCFPKSMPFSFAKFGFSTSISPSDRSSQPLHILGCCQ